MIVRASGFVAILSHTIKSQARWMNRFADFFKEVFEVAGAERGEGCWFFCFIIAIIEPFICIGEGDESRGGMKIAFEEDAVLPEPFPVDKAWDALAAWAWHGPSHVRVFAQRHFIPSGIRLCRRFAVQLWV